MHPGSIRMHLVPTSNSRINLSIRFLQVGGLQQGKLLFVVAHL
jgi:hypothetical protein